MINISNIIYFIGLFWKVMYKLKKLRLCEITRSTKKIEISKI
jgi:hypothetical protein